MNAAEKLLALKLGAAAVVLTGFIAAGGGCAAGYYLGKGDAPRLDDTSAAPAVVQKDGSVISERKPEAEPAPPPHEIPKGAKEIRRNKVTLKPAQPGCDPITLTTSLVEMDGGLRQINSAEGATVTSGLDLAIRHVYLAPAAHKWAVGPMADPINRRYGAWIDRDIGRVRLGAQITQERHRAVAVWLKAGITF